MRFRTARPSSPLRGTVQVPGDKSISHRAVLFSAMADGVSLVSGVLDSADVRSTIAAVESLGARVRILDAPLGVTPMNIDTGPGHPSGLSVAVTGWGAEGPNGPAGDIDCGNSGTTARLLLGMLAGWPVRARLVGDASLSTRPMRRVTGPLESMGARFETPTGTLPVIVNGGPLHPIQFVSPVASAQVKTAVLLAGLHAAGRTSVREPAASRDHTERMLPLFGVPVGRDDVARTAWVSGPVTLRPANIAVPGDPSSAAFIIAATLLTQGSRVSVPRVSLNPGRVGFLRVLERMGARVTATRVAGKPAGVEVRQAEGEPAGDLTAEFSPGLRGTVVTASEVPSLVDEVPVLALVASQAHGVTRFEGVGELRVKESDRLAAITDGLRALGAHADAGDDWLEVSGPAPLSGAPLSSLGDHRLAMTWAVAGLVCDGSIGIDGFEAIDVSYPTFVADLEGLFGGTIGEG